MRITFEPAAEHNIQNRSGVERQQPSMQDTVKKAEKAGAYSVNIGEQNGRAKDGTYKKEDMTEKDISMLAEGANADVQKMYMAVMSNSMSQDEFQKMVEEGYNVSDVDIETMVTILDRIKVAVAKGGGEISGFTDKLSKETMEQILGSTAYAEALENGLEEGAAAYMVEQEMEPTAENLYKAKYSAGAYQGAGDAEIPDQASEEGKAFWEQIDRVIREAGLPVNEESREDAAFLLQYDVPLTKENLLLYEKIKPFEKDGVRLSEEELKYRIGMQAYEGKAAAQADLSKRESIYEQAVNLYETVQGLTPEAADAAVRNHAEGAALTLKDMIESAGEEKGVSPEQAEKSGEQGLSVKGDRVEEQALSSTREAGEKQAASGAADRELAVSDNMDDGQIVSAENSELLAARRQLEEVRLRMTVEVNIKLLRSNFQIDTVPMEQLIERLKEAEDMLREQGIPQTAEVVEKLNNLRHAPAAALGYVVSREISFTIEALHEKGSELQSAFENGEASGAKKQAAKERYESMQTEVRPDLGDSIKKAFRNVDDILADMNREPSEENRRAVRILGYNRLELSEENINRALEVDAKVQNLFRDMKPGKVLRMIRDGVDVLHTDIGELDAYLTAGSDSFPQESEDFAAFLHKLDKSGEITAAERESYIGIYRLVRQVEKSDGRAEGYLLGSEAELTMENLLSAVRSGKKGFMDYKIDESFSGVTAMQRGKNIIEQIEAASYDAKEAYEETMHALEGAPQKAGDVRQEAADFLRETNQPVTVANLLAASSVLQEDAGLYQKIEDYEKQEEGREDALEKEQSRLEGLVAGLQDTVTDEESLQEGMETFAKAAEEILREAQNQDGVTELDIRDMKQLYQGIRFRTALSKESRYQIPVKMEEGYTVMNLTVRKGTGTAQAEISIETEKHGRLEAVFTESADRTAEAEQIKNGMSGRLFAETESGALLLEDVAGSVREGLSGAGIAVEEMTVMRGTRVRKGVSGVETVSDIKAGASATEVHYEKDGAQAEKSGQKQISTGELYQIAKIFLETVRNEK